MQQPTWETAKTLQAIRQHLQENHESVVETGVDRVITCLTDTVVAAFADGESDYKLERFERLRDRMCEVMRAQVLLLLLPSGDRTHALKGLPVPIAGGWRGSLPSEGGAGGGAAVFVPPLPGDGGGRGAK
jgi:hypothetical protein